MAKTYNETDSKVINLIAKGTKITGDIVSDGDVRIDGELVGNIDSKGRLVVGTSGKIKGEIKCKTSEISGNVDGKIAVNELLSLKSTSLISGDILTGKLSIEPGAMFSGSCNMGSNAKPAEEKPKKA